MQEWQQELIKRLKEGNHLTEFCTYADISTQTIYRLRDGKNLKEKTLIQIRTKWVAFERKINKRREILEIA